MQALLLDWSGTLVDDFTPTLQATNVVFEHYGLAPWTAAQFRKDFFLPYPDFYAQHLPQVPLAELETIFRDAFEQSEAGVCLLPWTMDLLDWAQSHGIRLLILTSMDPKNFEEQARRFEVWSRFEAVYSGVLNKCEKITEILQTHHLDPARCAYVGDMCHDVEAAKEGSLQSIAVLTGYDSAQALSAQQPDLLVAHVGKLTEILKTPRHYKRPTPTVGALVYNDQGEFLLVKSYKWKNRWGIPGGKIEYGESAQEALQREMREETGLQLEEIRFVCVQDCIDSEEFHQPAHFLLLNYTAKAVRADQVVLNDEAHQYRWVSSSELENLVLNQATIRLLEQLTEQSTP